jgi:hypothetical protein
MKTRHAQVVTSRSHTELAHLGEATGVVADGAVAVDGEGGEHAEGGHCDTVPGHVGVTLRKAGIVAATRPTY